MEGVGEAGEETEGDEVGEDEGREEREGGVRPEGASFQEGEAMREEGFEGGLGGLWAFGGAAVDEPGG